jgi:hypothetical protein
MRKLLTALGTATILMASNGIIWKAEAAMVTSVGNLPLSNSYSLVEKVRCVCGPYGCTCGDRRIDRKHALWNQFPLSLLERS